jgi:hypothetical protein
MQWMADAIEEKFYREGRKEDLLAKLKDLRPKENHEFKSLRDLEDIYNEIVGRY